MDSFDTPFIFGKNRCDCSLHGSCFDLTNNTLFTGICACNRYWTGVTSFVNSEGNACPVNQIVLCVLWSFTLVNCIFVYYLVGVKDTLHFLKSKYNPKATLLKQDIRWVVALMILFGIIPSVIAQSAMAIIGEATNHPFRVGQNIGFTTLWILSRAGFYLATALYQPKLIESILKSESKALAVVKKSVRVTRVS